MSSFTGSMASVPHTHALLYCILVGYIHQMGNTSQSPWTPVEYVKRAIMMQLTPLVGLWTEFRGWKTGVVRIFRQKYAFVLCKSTRI